MYGALEPDRPRRTISVVVQWSLIALLVVLAIAQTAVGTRDILVWDMGNTGIATPSDLVTIVVQPGSAAQRAGVRNGDRIDPGAMALHDRLVFLGQAATAGQEATLAVRRGNESLAFRYRMDPVPRTVIAVAGRLEALLVGAFALLLGAFVLARTPSVDAVTFALFSLSWCQLWLIGPGQPDDLVIPATIAQDVTNALSVAGVLLLAVRAGQPYPGRRRNEWLAIGAAAIYLPFYAASDSGIAIGAVVPAPFVQWMWGELYPVLLVDAVCFAIVLTATVRARGAARVRPQWFAAGFACWLLGVGAADLYRLPQFAWGDWVQLAGFAPFVLGQCLFAYPIARYDLFGVGFIVNRATIYAVVTAIIVGAFAGANWLIGTTLKSRGLALPVDVLLAAAAGLSLNVVQRRVNLVVDRALFRHRYEVAARLRRVARALAHATDDDTIGDAVVVEPVEALGLHAAAFFTRAEDGTFRRVAAQGWPANSPTAIAANDRLVLHLLGAGEGPLRMEGIPHSAAFPHGPSRPRIAFPLWSRREMIGIALYSAHVNGATLDPEEVEEIERITTAATAAFDRVAAAALRRTQDELLRLRAAYDELLSRSAPSIS